jgi:arabinogalactan oligomer / maltooligosaccharide transport system permease protein
MRKSKDTFKYQDAKMVTSSRERIVGSIIRWTIIVLAIAFALFPVLFIVSSAISPDGQLSSQTLIPSKVVREPIEIAEGFTALVNPADTVKEGDVIAKNDTTGEEIKATRDGVIQVTDNVLTLRYTTTVAPLEMLKNFRALTIDQLDTYPFWNWMFNSFIVATVSTVLTVLITVLSAYSFSRFRFRGRESLLLGIRLLQVFPNLLALVALYLILQQIKEVSQTLNTILPVINWGFLQLFGLDSLGGVILVYMAGAMGINTLLMKGFLDTIPREIDESATVDGATHWQTFWQLIFPLVTPILAVVGVLAFVGTFNEFVLARIILRDKENWTLMVGLFNFVNSDFSRDWGKFAAGALIAGVPVVALYIALQDRIVGGLTQGAVKG